jgi:hypothetical protein
LPRHQKQEHFPSPSGCTQRRTFCIQGFFAPLLLLVCLFISSYQARPIPIFEPFVPEKQEHKLEVEPFQLQTEARGQKATKRMSEQMRKQKKTEIEKRNFKAQPMPITDRPVCSFFLRFILYLSHHLA